MRVVLDHGLSHKFDLRALRLRSCLSRHSGATAEGPNLKIPDMTFTTLTYNGVEKSLADWNISQCEREIGNQAHDHLACKLLLPADADDPIPYGGKIILRIGRAPSSGAGTNAAGLPLSGNTSWTGGTQWFIGWRVETFRSGSPALEKFDLKFAGPWEFFFERLVFQKLWFTWNGTANVADWRSQIVLGQSVNALVGPNDTVPGSNATNLMSIRQQIAEIIAYVAGQTTIDYGSPQLQSDALTSAIDGTNWDLYVTPGTNLLIPDYIPGYAATGKTSAQTGTTAADMRTVLRAPLDAVNDITCAEALRRQLKWIGPMGDGLVWFDYSTTPPTLHVATRDQLPAVSLPFVGTTENFRIKKRDDLTPSAVALKFRITGSNSGSLYTEVVHDVAGTVSGAAYEGIGLTGALYTAASAFGGSPAFVGGSANSATMQALEAAGRDFAGVTATIDMEGNSSNLIQCSIKTMAVNTADPSSNSSAIPFWQKIFPEFKTLAATPSLFSGSSVSVTADDPGGADDGNAVDLSTFQYLLTDGQIAPWMLAGNAPSGTAAQVVQAVINAKWVISEVSKVGSSSIQTAHVPYHEKTARVTLVSIPGGVYQHQAGFVQGEVVPYGLAGFIYNIAKIPQFEGSFSVQEIEVSDVCPMGNNLNISGGRSEWAAMNACVQQISYDLTNGRTTLRFGPAAHLGARDMVERLRANRGPRQIYFIGSNITNDANQQAGAQLGNSVAQRGPSPGTRAPDLQIFPASLSDLASNSYAHGNPGLTVDVRGSGQPNYGNISGLGAPNAPILHLQLGSGGTAGGCVRISPADLPSNAQAYFQQVSYSQCVNVSGTPTMKTYSFYILCTTPTETS